MLAQTVGVAEIIAVLVYLLAIGYLGWLGYRRTKTATDYLIAGRKVHPYVMAMSYGATFISTSAIVGFGGVAGLFGMSLLWLTFLNIFLGIFVAFVCLGGPARNMGHRLDAHTFPELLGRRFDSKFVQVFAGLVIFVFMPLYAAAVLIGGTEFICTQFGIDYNVALLVFAVIVAAYVVVGGLKGVMYTDALQASIMFVGMAVLLIFGYAKVGGLVAGHDTLTELASMVPGSLKAIGHQGWTAMPKFGWGDKSYNLWWIVVNTIVMGVGIGVLAQPQLAVRFMTVKSKRELNRAVAIGGVFILMMTGTAFTIGSLSNAYFAKHGELFTGRVQKIIDAGNNEALIQPATQMEDGTWKEKEGNPIPVLLDADKPYLDADQKIAQGRSISIVYAKGNPDQIIPAYISAAMPKWFGVLFLLTLLAAAMSTLSSQFHTLGTGIGRDVYEQLTGRHGSSILVTRIGIIIGIIIAVIFSATSRGGYIIARATAIFFGLCASAFLPALLGALFWRRVTRAGAKASMVIGFVVTSFWLLFIKDQEASAIGLCKWMFNKTSLLLDYNNWPVVDPMVVALPLSFIVLIVVSLGSKPSSDEHLSKCFGK